MRIHFHIVIPTSSIPAGLEGEGWGAALKKTLFDATTGPN
jgi:hypothetical protein